MMMMMHTLDFNIDIDLNNHGGGSDTSSAIDFLYIKELLQKVLNKKFSTGNPKNEIIETSQGYSVACPYCGDSTTDIYKKRGILYFNSMEYHCYNCTIHKKVIELCRDFLHIDKSEEFVIIRSANVSRNSLESIKRRTYASYIDLFFDKSLIDSFKVSKIDFMEQFNLRDIKNSSIEKYLENRCQVNFDDLAYSINDNKLFIFNMVDKDHFIGFQIRHFNRDIKYTTHSLVKVYEYLKRETDIIPTQLNTLSSIFGIFSINMDDKITIFEGPLDAKLFYNSVGLSSVGKSLPFTIENVQYLLDFDKAGMEKSLKLIKEGNSVFLWKKFIEEEKIDKKKKLDWTDICMYYKKENRKFPELGNYFSKDKYDIIYI